MNKRAAVIAFVAAVAVQVLILAGVPLQKVLTRARGETVFLKVLPVDPYNILSGYYVILRYEISNPSGFPASPSVEDGETVYAVIEEGADGLWNPISLERSLPSNLPAHRAVIRGREEDGRIVYGIEEYFIPEAKRAVIDDELRQHIDSARVEVKVDADGNAALIRLWIEGRPYE